MTTTTPINLLGLDKAGLREFFLELDEKPYRADQVLKWLHFNGVADFNAMSNISKSLRAKLASEYPLTMPTVMHEKIADDGTTKWLLKLEDGNCIETVYIPERTRGTLCISSQVGCVLNCDFCSTGKQGFSRNLTSAEIISQVWIAVRKLSQLNGLHDRQVTNVVFMGMGEPLLNLNNVLPVINILLDDFAYGLSKRRVTVSTAGVIPAMHELRAASDVALAVSLHAPNDALRNELVPLNKKYPLRELMTVCKSYFADEPRRAVTMEYVMLKGVNDTPKHARELIKILHGVPAKVNLIPFNQFPNSSYVQSDMNTIENFLDILMAADIHTTIRRTRGEKIDAACGQLVGNVQDRTRRKAQYHAKYLAKQAADATSL